MGYYQDINNTYGSDTLMLMKQWSNMNRRLANVYNRRLFLLRCRRTNTVPKHILDGIKNIQSLLFTGNNTTMTDRVDNFIFSLAAKTLSLEIKITCDTLSKINKNIDEIKQKLKRLIPFHVFSDYNNRLKGSYVSVFEKIKQGNINKFNNLKQNRSKENVLFLDNKKWFKNISSVDIPQEICDFLSLGPKFGVTCQRDDLRIDRFLADVENIIDITPDECKDILRAKVTNVTTNFLQKSRIQEPSFLNSTYKKSKNFLKEHNNLYILQSDKGGCTVAMDKSDYTEKTEALLSDASTYVKLKRDPTTTVQTSHNKLIKSLKGQNEITSEEEKYLMIYNSSFPKLYCLPKVHKPGVPLRPIVSSINSTTYNLSKFLANILKVSFEHTNSYNIKDTFSFVLAMENCVLPENYVLISLDVVSLFTNIPLDLVIHILEINWDLIEKHTKISKQNFMTLIHFIFNNTYFAFNDDFYKQIFGTPMGSPISPILATIILDHLLDSVIPGLPFSFAFIYKYVDDIICAVPSDFVPLTLTAFNSFNDSLKFTIEQESNCSVPFLDTRVIRTTGNKIILDWYSKDTASGRFLNYHSNHPKNQKYNTVIAMKNRVTHICHESLLQNNLKKLHNMFLNNGYPNHILKKLIYNSNVYDGPTEDGNNVVQYRKLPYIHDLTHAVVSIFREFPNIKIAKYNSLGNHKLFSKVKQKTPLEFNNNLIYKVSCLGCQGCYIGQTSQWLKQRVTQHKSDCRVGKNSCAVVEHCLRTGHQFDYTNIKVLDQETNYKSRLFLEMCHISENENAINFKTDTNKLSNIYCNILQKRK